MTRRSVPSGRVSGLVLVTLMVVAIPSGLGLAEGLQTFSGDHPSYTSAQTHLPTLTPPALTETPTPTPTPGGDSSPTSTSTPTPGEDPSPTSSPTPTPSPTATPTPTPTPSPDASGGGDGQRLLVDGEPPEGAVSEEDCPDASYDEIQPAVEEAAPGDTVVVCAGTYTSVDIETANLTLQTDPGAEALIRATGRPAVRVTAPGSTLRGFAVEAVQARRAIVVGANRTVIRDANVTVPTDETGEGVAVGVFLDDGRTADGEPAHDSAVGTAGSRVANSTIHAGESADYGVWAAADRSVVRATRIDASGNTTAILTTGTDNRIKNNTIRFPTVPQERGTGYVTQGGSRPAIEIGDPSRSVRERATGTLAAGNTIRGAPHDGIRNLRGTTGTVIRGNTISNTPTDGILVEGNDTLVLNNTVTDAGNDGVVIGWFPVSPTNVTVVRNTAVRVQDGVTIGGRNATVRGNTLRNNRLDGVDTLPKEPVPSGLVVNNTLTNNDGAGIRVETMPWARIEAHRNRIWENGAMGIHNYNFDPNDGRWPIMNATRNVWGCGGPSSGLQDPETGRVANGTGDPISAGDDAGVSNVRFDPFYVRQDVTCPAPLSNPTPAPRSTSTRTPTPNPTASPTPTPTPTEPQGPSVGTTHTGETGGTGSTGQGDDAGGDAGASGGPSGGQTAGPSTATRPPSTQTQPPTPTPTPTPTVSPTPRVEPGFDVFAWVLGIVVFVGLVVVRRRRMAVDGRD